MSAEVAEIFPVSTEFARQTHLNAEQYKKMYERSLRDPKNFWSEQAQKFVTWFKPWDAVLTGDFTKNDTVWFQNGKLNAAYNCLDRHLEKRAQQTAIIWEGDDPQEVRNITYAELCGEVSRFANVLKKQGVKKRQSRLYLHADDS